MLTLLFRGVGMGGGQADESQTNITVDLWQDFESDTLDTTSLDAHDHFAPTGQWSITDASGKLSTSAAAEMTFGGTINGEPDVGTRGLVYDANGGAQAYLTFSHPVQRTQISWGFPFRVTGAGFFSSFGEYDLFRNSVDLGLLPSLIKIVDDTNETRFHLFVPSDYSPGIAIQPDTDYWVTGKHVKNGTVVARLYDLATGNQVGAEQELAVGNENLTELLFGPFVGGPDCDSRIHLDDLVLDWTNAVFPLGPPVATEVPDVVGETEAAGTTTLEDAGFVVSVSTAYHASVAAGLIISQDPEGGEFAPGGSTVEIVVSLGPEPVVVDVRPAGKKRRKRYVVTIDGQSFEVQNTAEAVQLLEKAKAVALEVAEQSVEREVKKSRRRKRAIRVYTPEITSSPEIAEAVSVYRDDIEAIYKRIAVDAEIRELMRLKMLEEDEDDALFVLLH